MSKGSCILHSEMDVSDDSVNCVYLVKDECRAQPIVDKEEGYYKPTEEDRKIFCTKRYHIRDCPRLQSYEAYLKALGLKKGTIEGLQT